MTNATAAKSTPTPWKLNANFRSPVIGYDPQDGNPELLPIAPVVQGFDREQCEANAALIVLAVNHHAELVATLAGLLCDTKATYEACATAKNGPIISIGQFRRLDTVADLLAKIEAAKDAA